MTDINKVLTKTHKIRNLLLKRLANIKDNNMDTYDAAHFLDSEFSQIHQALLPNALETAYAAVEELYKNEPLFDVTSAKMNKGHVVSWAVDKQIERLLESGKLPYDYSWTNFEKPTGKYLQIRLQASTMSVSQLPFSEAVPRQAHFRNNRILNNQPFFDIPEFGDQGKVTGLPHLILSHGYQNLNFAQVGLLNPEPEKFGWIHRTENLLKMPHIVESDLPPVEACNTETILTLKEEINRWVKDNHE